MNHVRVYTTPSCGYCYMAKNLLRRLEIAFEEIDVSLPAERAKIRAQSGWPTVPVIYIGDELIGGFNELQDVERAGRLKELLARE